MKKKYIIIEENSDYDSYDIQCYQWEGTQEEYLALKAKLARKRASEWSIYPLGEWYKSHPVYAS